MSTYQSICFSHAPDWARVPTAAIDSFHWEGETAFRPNSFFQLCFEKGQGVHVRLWSDETALRCVCTERDDPVYEDSCLEFFFAPFSDKGYFNVEMNPRGVFLAQYGTGREARVFLKTLTGLSPTVEPLAVKDGWGVACFLPCGLIEQVCGRPFSADAGSFRGNFYKCGDKTAVPHYAAFSPVDALPPGFHAPAHFATIEIREEEQWNL